MHTLNVSVPTVHCNSCKLTIQESLDELHGVAATQVDLDAKQVTVTYDPDSVDPTTITATIEDAGYPVAGSTGAPAGPGRRTNDASTAIPS